MKTTAYFTDQVLRKRPYIDLAMCQQVLGHPALVTVQSDGRIRHWGYIVDPRDGRTRALRVVTLDDGVTVHNASWTEISEETCREAPLRSRH